MFVSSWNIYNHDTVRRKVLITLIVNFWIVSTYLFASTIRWMHSDKVIQNYKWTIRKHNFKIKIDALNVKAHYWMQSLIVRTNSKIWMWRFKDNIENEKAGGKKKQQPTNKRNFHLIEMRFSDCDQLKIMCSNWPIH